MARYVDADALTQEWFFNSVFSLSQHDAYCCAEAVTEYAMFNGVSSPDSAEADRTDKKNKENKKYTEGIKDEK